MRKPQTFAIMIGLAGLAAFLFARQPRTRIGGHSPTIVGNLRMLDGAKQVWLTENKPVINVWPSPADLAPYLVHGGANSLSEAIPSTQGEIYIINRSDRPVAVYFTQDAFGLKAGQLVTLEDFDSQSESGPKP